MKIRHNRRVGDKVQTIHIQKEMLQKMAWERAKGDINGLIAICTTEPVTEHCRIIENKAIDLILSLDSLMYNWVKDKPQEIIKARKKDKNK